ncbi:hypothetical protein D3C71_89540 [compost metagenome]
MKKVNLLINGLLGLCCLVSLFSCKENTLEPNATPAKMASMDSKDTHWQSFNTMEDFTKTMQQLHSYSDKELAAWEQVQAGFVSWRSNTENSSDSTITDIPDAALATVINSQGRIQIADTIYQFVPGEKQRITYSIPSRYITDLRNGKTGYASWSGVKINDVTMTWLPFPRWEDPERILSPDPNTDICDFPSAFMFPWWGQKGGQIYHGDNGSELPRDNGRRVRIEYHRWRVGFLFYSSAGVRVKAWKDTRFGGWMSTVNMDHVTIKSCIKGIIIIPGLFPQAFHESVNLSATNTNKLEKTLKWAATPMHVEVLPEHFNLRFKVNYKGQQIDRFIRE